MSLTSREEFKNTPRGQYKYWSEEVKAFDKRMERWHRQADKIVKRYMDDREAKAVEGRNKFRLNLFTANTNMLMSMLYGNVPKVDVSRRYADANDDNARVAAEVMERLLNNDLAKDGEEFSTVMRSALFDRLVPGVGVGRVRYEAEFSEIEVEINGETVVQEELLREAAPIDYYYWKDMKWSWGRSFKDLTWLGYVNYMDRDEVKERFGEEIAKALTYKKQHTLESETTREDPTLEDNWEKAEVIEIWDKVKRQVVWISIGFDRVLDTKDDPLQLQNFFPSGQFFMANPTTSIYKPTPDFHLAQDLYNEIDILQTRIAVITEACKAVGVYDSTAEGVRRMFEEGIENDLIPVNNWSRFVEGGGLQGSIDWLPIADLTNALTVLVQQRDNSIALLQQVTGMSDIMRGSLSNQYEGVGQSQIKAQFGSVQIQKMQEEFANFGADLLQIKAEIIEKHFDPSTIIEKSNMEHSYDVDKLGAALELIKDPYKLTCRVAIRPETMAMVDYARLKSERTEYLTAVSTFMQSAAPLMESEPAAKPFLLKLLQWGLAGFKGSSEIEGVIDKAIDASMAQAQQQQQQPDSEEQRAQAQMAMEQQKMTFQMELEQLKHRNNMELRQLDKQADIETRMADMQADMQKITATMQAKLAEIEAKYRSDIQTERVTSAINAEQQAAAVSNEITKDAIDTENEIRKEAFKTTAEMAKISAAKEGSNDGG